MENFQLCSKNSPCLQNDEFGRTYVCGKMLDNPDRGNTGFDNILQAFMMVFQIVTLEGWSEIMIQIIHTTNTFMVFYFIILVLIGGFFLVNLTLAVITIHFIYQ